MIEQLGKTHKNEYGTFININGLTVGEFNNNGIMFMITHSKHTGGTKLLYYGCDFNKVKEIVKEYENNK